MPQIGVFILSLLTNALRVKKVDVSINFPGCVGWKISRAAGSSLLQAFGSELKKMVGH